MPRKVIVLDFVAQEEAVLDKFEKVAKSFPQAIIYIYFGSDELQELNDTDKISLARKAFFGNPNAEYTTLRSILTLNHSMEDLILVTAKESAPALKEVFPESLVIGHIEKEFNAANENNKILRMFEHFSAKIRPLHCSIAFAWL